MAPRTLYAKIWDEHVVMEDASGVSILYVDRHFINEVTSAQAFESLRQAGRKPWRPASSFAVADHNVPTIARHKGVLDSLSRVQIETLEENCRKAEILHIPLLDERQGILHVVGPEEGATLPGTTIVCGDSHTSTHGAFGALAFGIGTSEVEHVLATQTLLATRSKSMLVRFDNLVEPGVYAKDLAMAFIGTIGAAGGTGYVVEYAGDAVASLSMEGRMTLCNMTIEAGARAGLVAVDVETIRYLQGRTLAPVGDLWCKAADYWSTLRSDDDAVHDSTVTIDASCLEPQVTWGTSPDMVAGVSHSVPRVDEIPDGKRRVTVQRALDYMGLKGGESLAGLQPDRVFIGSCTNARIEDLREVAKVISLHGGSVSRRIKEALIVPGSGRVKRQAEEEGLDQLFLMAGFSWREPGCSMCLAMNADRLLPGERCASTSNRNFEGRQGNGGRTHLLSPAMAALAALEGAIADVRELLA